MAEAQEDITDRVNRPPPKFLWLRVLGPDNNEIHFKMRLRTSLGKLIRVFCDMKDIRLEICRFRYNGRILLGNETVRGLGMKNNDIIRVTRIRRYRTHKAAVKAMAAAHISENELKRSL